MAPCLRGLCGERMRIIRGWWTGAATAACARTRALFRSGGSSWHRRVIVALTCVVLVGAAAVSAAALFTASVVVPRLLQPRQLAGPRAVRAVRISHHWSRLRHQWPAAHRARTRSSRLLSRYEDIPPIVREAILATEDKRFFSHNGVDYWSVPRVLVRIRLRTLLARLFRNPFDEAARPPSFRKADRRSPSSWCAVIS